MRKAFQNLDNAEVKSSFNTFLRWRRERAAKVKDLSFAMPRADYVRVEYLQNNRNQQTITWIGHATFLIQIDGLNILTDPVWANRMGLEKRLAPPGLALADLPLIDVVLISHNHYDHLDFYSLKRLKGNPLHLVPDGLIPTFKKKGLAHVKESTWWESLMIQNVVFTFVPAQHWSKRTVRDTNASHWGGWVIQKRNHGSAMVDDASTVYFAGDSGYFSGFKAIGEKFKIKYALMPIGAYEPEWFMSVQHVTPEQAIQAYLDTGASNFVPMHFEAFRLSDDTPQEALSRLQREWTRRELATENLQILKLGETIVGTNLENQSRSLQTT